MLSPAASSVTVLFFGPPAASFDFDSFSFHVPISASLAAKALTASRQNASINRLVLIFMLPPLRKIVGLVDGADSSLVGCIVQGCGTRPANFGYFSRVLSLGHAARPHPASLHS